jgi:FlaA1/EpsC-like NDP-sugar epimerase
MVSALLPRKRALVTMFHRQGVVVLLDALIVTAAYESAAVIRFVDSGRILDELTNLMLPCFLAGLLYSTVAYLLGLPRRLWRYANMRDALALLKAVGITTLLVGILDLASQPLGLDGSMGARPLPLSVVLGGACLSFLLLGCARVLPKMIVLRQATHGVANPLNTTRVVIVGAGDAGVTLAARFAVNHAYGYRVIGFVDDDPAKQDRSLCGIRVLGPVSLVPDLASRQRIDLVAIAMPSAPPGRISQIIGTCHNTAASIKIWPGLDEALRQRLPGVQLREVNAVDLLGREVVPLRASEIDSFLEGMTVLVTGAAGSIGSELSRQLMGYRPAKVIALDNNETGLFELAASVTSSAEHERLRLQIGDITDRDGVERLLAAHRPDIIFHAAAYKHVPLLEAHPAQAARINVLGTYDLCRLASTWGVGVFVFVSSDKAAEPVNVLGATKRIGELIVQAVGESEESGTRFCAVRFGNVIGSRGSVVPTFVQQIEHGGPVTVTDPEATRYFMTVAEACGLVVFTATMRDDGGVYLLDMGDPVHITELAARLIRSRGLRVGRDISITYTGLRPGERIHEVLVGPGESLVPSAHPSIRQVVGRGVRPALSAIDDWVAVLRQRCDEEDPATLRRRLLGLAREEAAVR